MLLIALAIRIESKGPVFYVAKRAGKGYKIFNFYKFRTMFVGADEKIAEFLHLNQYDSISGEGPVFFKISNDPRITKVGSFLRNTSMDELPQLFNVLLGNMSLVGNRPLPLYEAETLTTDDWARRFMAPAGITGLWQIKKRGREDMSVEERINLDIDYANKSNFAYDLWIMANTPSALFQKTNV
jgi:lipopolysaccharide/colanic/teichoic acid biosynthesis glycosyltransferase